jgi:hypothetical protein
VGDVSTGTVMPAVEQGKEQFAHDALQLAIEARLVRYDGACTNKRTRRLLAP